MINIYDTVETYIGNGTLATYAFNFKVRSATDILIIVYDTSTNVLVFEERGNVLANVTSVTFDAINGGGSITLPANLSATRKLIIKLAADTPLQTFRFRDQSEFDLRQFEHALDNIMIYVQRLDEKISRTFRLSDKASYNSSLNMMIDAPPLAQGVPIFDATGNFLEFKTPAQLTSATGGIISVLDNTARDAISTTARFQGLIAYVTSTGINWQLRGGILNANWGSISTGTPVIGIDRFSGNGVTVAFVLSVTPLNENNTFVYINGVYQQKDTYSLVTNTLTFSSAPPTGVNNVEVSIVQVI